MKKPFGWIAVAVAALALAACDPPPMPDQVDPAGNVTDDCTGPRCEDVTDTK